MKLKVLKSGVTKNSRKIIYKIEGNESNTIVSLASKYFLGDNHGNIVSRGYTQIKDSRYGITIAMINEKIYVLNSKGEEIKKDLDRARIEKNIIVFCENGLWGIMDFSCNMILKPSFSFISKYKNGYALFSIPALSKYEKVLWGIINEKGEIIFEPIYKMVILRDDNVVALNKFGLYGCMKLNKKIIAPFIYSKIKLTDEEIMLYNNVGSKEEILIKT